MNKLVLVRVVVIGMVIYSFLENKFLLYSMPEILLFKYDKNRPFPLIPLLCPRRLRPMEVALRDFLQIRLNFRIRNRVSLTMALRVAHINVRSLVPHVALVRDVAFHRLDILAVEETWLQNSTDSGFVDIDNYVHVRSNPQVATEVVSRYIDKSL